MSEKLIRKALKNARNRALYWSGNPSFSKNRYNPNNARKNADFEYELAMDDIDSLCRELERITGKPMDRYDPKGAFIRRYNAAMLKSNEP